ncbi:CDP-glycerol--poly(glycerophosphate) glycerophosphotransferase [Alteromonas alba]|jgi:CDP-glycerol glycerophosphotransferase (TagB/SpsB family)|uniref:CDP-glycerol--poly(Glycerophosphate) glycerophosphotransferase n=1 Tax=Alteromonas alba TaxID=2079529 RepID=A0A2S9V833_9ALTE|nr:CDP-glycerol glycerophosphotransferase family protein [Alteromonas alba]PRO72598.1 CDP-glycerol--poly(glycerophosphate) glycerophosphotransferase [Alteromonas alba]
MTKRYVLFATLPYAYAIFRPLQTEILARGDEVAWYLESGCENYLNQEEVLLNSIDEVVAYNPIAIFACGNHIYHFLPGTKVALFHGYAVGKRGEKGDVLDDHFTIRNWFDIYCTQGPSSTPIFKMLEQKHGFFKSYETGWCKVDPYFTQPKLQNNGKTTILYSPTFSRGITSVETLYDTIAHLASKRDWHWIITFHPKITDSTIIERYKSLAMRLDNVSFERNEGLPTLQRADLMLCDSSSIILEFMLLDKPVVTYRNTNPGPHLLDVTDTTQVEPAIEEALTMPETLMQSIKDYTWQHEAHRDGNNSARVLDAVDDFNKNHKGTLKAKPRNWLRKFKLRKKLGYWK